MLEDKNQRIVFIVGDTIRGQLSTGVRQLGPKAVPLANRFGCRPVGVLFGRRIEAAANRWSEMARMPVIAMESKQCRYPNPTIVAAGVSTLVDEHATAAVCFPHSMRTCQAAAALGWRLAIPCITAVESVVPEGAGLTLERSQYGGRLTARLAVPNLPVVLTVIAGNIPGPKASDDGAFLPSVETRRLAIEDDRLVPISMAQPAHREQDLENSQVIVSGGRGLGGTEQADQLEKTAAMFKNAAVGASRGACDMGWLPHSRQIGETGRTVSPALYLACGISGAPQHIAGMRDARTIVAVNTDPKAAISNLAHYAVEEDLNTFLPLLRERYEETFTKGDTDENR